MSKVTNSTASVLDPVASYEVDKIGGCWVHNVVLPCGAVSLYDGERILEAEDETLDYYRAAVTAICVVKARIGDLISGS